MAKTSFNKITLFLLIASAVYASCKRCSYTTIGFRTKFEHGHPNPEQGKVKNQGRRCRDFGGSFKTVDQSYGRNNYEGICKISVCGDGKVHDGHYCGVGPCNMFGYNCEGGCHPGNPVEEFKRIHGDEVFLVERL